MTTLPLLQPYRFTVDEYQRLAREGFIRPDARVELIDGEIVEMTPIGSQHNAVVDRLARLCHARVDEQTGVVRVQGSIQLDDVRSPQPDLAVLRRQEDYYAGALPGPSDVLLLVEVADSSLVYDRGAKALLYAQSGIAEYWLVDLVQRQVVLHTRPAPGGYQQVDAKQPGDSWRAHLLPQLTLTGADVFG